MTDVKVEQCDRVLGLHFIPRNSVAGQDSEGVLAGKYDDAEAIVLVARHRQAAEKATREECLEPVRFIDEASGDDFNLGWNAAMQAVGEAIRIRSQNDD